MPKTILITGSSSGIGRACVDQFAEKGWQVLATMRHKDEALFAQYPNVSVLELDVTKPRSVQKLFANLAQQDYNLDVILNNAGYGVSGIFEAMDDAVIADQFETNVYGVLRMTREAIRFMRPRKQGLIIQVASMGGRVSFPLYSIYHATKWAVEGFAEALQFELEPLNIRVKLIEPGVIQTSFYHRNRVFITPADTSDYTQFLKKINSRSNDLNQSGADPKLVAETIWQAATDGTQKLRYPVAAPAPTLLFFRRFMPDWLYRLVIKAAFGI